MCRLVLAAGLLSGAVLAAGCNRAPVVVEHGRVVALATTDFRIHPQKVRVRRGRVTFRIVNRGRLPHNWVISGRGVHGQVKTMLPGDRRVLRVRLRHGVYRMYSSLGHDMTLGQYGTVSVR